MWAQRFEYLPIYQLKSLFGAQKICLIEMVLLGTHNIIYLKNNF